MAESRVVSNATSSIYLLAEANSRPFPHVPGVMSCTKNVGARRPPSVGNARWVLTVGH